MNGALKASILANLVLAALILWLARRQQTGAPDSPLNASAGATVEVPAPPTAAPEPAQKFQWSQLESTDYHTYIANLRAIGCPKQTIQDIIVADVDSLYALRRAQLQQGPAVQVDQRKSQAQLQQLRNEEVGVLQALLGAPSPVKDEAGALAASPAAVEAPIRRSRFGNSPNDSGPIPVAFQDPGPDMELKPAQIEIINDVRETFTNALKGLDPNSPEYARRWQEAQAEADQRMGALLGYTVWLESKIKARNQSPPGP
jgi:hypothetical protein